MRSSVPSQLQSSKWSYTVERGGRSLGIARHWQPVLRMYISPFTTSRTFTVRLLPPRLPGRMSGSTWLHSSSVKSLGYRSLLRSYRARFSIVHIGGLSTAQAAILASQTLDPIQYVLEQALTIRANCLENNLVLWKFEKGKRSSVKWIRNTPTARHQWHDLKVRVSGNRVEGYLDGKLYLEHTLPEAVSGRIGLWSKADSYMHFDEFTATPGP